MNIRFSFHIAFLMIGQFAAAGTLPERFPYKLQDCVRDTTSAGFHHKGQSSAIGWKHWPEFDVKTYGAAGDGKTLDTPAIDKAIDAAAAAGGGKVLLRNGVFLSGSLFLKPKVALVIEKDATLKATTDEKQYPTIKTRMAGIDMPWPAGLINADNINGVRIVGNGTVDGQGRHWWEKLPRTPDIDGIPNTWVCGRPRPILVSRCKDVYIEGLTIRNSPFWTCHVVYSEKVEINGLTIRNVTPRGPAPSSDGIDIDSCRDVLVRNCDLDCDDDCIVIKSGRDGDGFRRNEPSENIVVRDCLARRGHSIVAIGTEVAGSVRNVYVANCRGEGTRFGVRLKSKIGRGGVVEDIVYENINMTDVHNPIRFRLTGTTPDTWLAKIDPTIPILKGDVAVPRYRNILLRNIAAVRAQSCLSFHFSDGALPFENITFENVTLRGAQSAEGHTERKNWNTRLLTVNGEKVFGAGSGPGAPPELYEKVRKAVAHVQPLAH